MRGDFFSAGCVSGSWLEPDTLLLEELWLRKLKRSLLPGAEVLVCWFSSGCGSLPLLGSLV